MVTAGGCVPVAAVVLTSGASCSAWRGEFLQESPTAGKPVHYREVAVVQSMASTIGMLLERFEALPNSNVFRHLALDAVGGVTVTVPDPDFYHF